VLTDRRFAVLAFILLVIFWGTSFPAVKIALGHAPPVLFAGIRALLGGLAMTAAAVIWGGKVNLRRNWSVLALLTLFNVVLFIGCQTFTILYLPSGLAAVLIYLQPILVGFLAWLMLGESLSPAKLIGLFLGFSGVVAVSAGSIFGTMPPLGVAFGVATALFWALGTVYFKRAQERVSTLWSVAAPFLIGGVFLTALGLILEPWSEISWTGTFVASWLYASLVGTAFAWALWLGLVRAGEASRVAAYVFFVPLIAVLVGVLFLGETLSPSLLVGAALVVSGIYLVNRQQSS
jgi:drug/metabolite transporter (DMT)-like permease